MSLLPSPVAMKRQLCGYTPATSRPRCGSCLHVRAAPEQLTCGKNRMLVTAYAVCRDWECGQKPLNTVPNRSKTEIRPHGAGAGVSAPVAAGPKEVS